MRESEAAYLYAIVPAAAAGGWDARGIEDASVYTISQGGVAAVVSGLPRQTLRPERRHIAAHQRVLKCIMADTALLPISFGILARSPGGVRRMLWRNQAAFLNGLCRVAGNVEMGLRVTWDVPNIFEYFVRTHPELRDLRDLHFSSGREPPQEAKIEIGRLFERLLGAERDRHADEVEATLSPQCLEIKRGNCRQEQEVMNLACLVAKDNLPGFERSVREAAQRFDNSSAFDYSGPWPPYNFVELDLKV